MESQDRISSRLAAGVGLIAVGVVILVAQWLPGGFWAASWPFLFVAIGVVLFVAMVSGGKRSAGLAIPATILTVLGLLLFVQNVTGQWQSWAYAWTLLWPVAVGIGILIQGLWGGLPKQVEEGRHLIRLGVVLLLAGIAFFELILNIGGWGIARGALARYVLPILLIAVGGGLLFRSMRSGSGRGASGVPSAGGSEQSNE